MSILFEFGAAHWPVAVVFAVLLLAYRIVDNVWLERREGQALRLAPRVSRAGGDPADVLRSLNSPRAITIGRPGGGADTTEVAGVLQHTDPGG